MASLRYCTVPPPVHLNKYLFLYRRIFSQSTTECFDTAKQKQKQQTTTCNLHSMYRKHAKQTKNKRCAKTQNANCYVARTENSEACRTLPRLPEQTKVEIYDTAVNETSFQNYYLDFILFGADTIQNLGGACTSRPKKISSACCDHICASCPHKLEPIEVWSGGAALRHQAVTPWPASEHFTPQGTIDIELCLGTASKAIQFFQDLDRKREKEWKRICLKR